MSLGGPVGPTIASYVSMPPPTEGGTQGAFSAMARRASAMVAPRPIPWKFASRPSARSRSRTRPCAFTMVKVAPRVWRFSRSSASIRAPARSIIGDADRSHTTLKTLSVPTVSS